MSVSSSVVLFIGFTTMLVLGLGLTVYARLAWGRPRRRHRHA